MPAISGAWRSLESRRVRRKVAQSLGTTALRPATTSSKV